MDQMNETGHDEMLNCPKCGFQQPRDQYCAKCGVDMVKAAQARSKSSPLLIAGVAVVLSGLGFFAYSKFFVAPVVDSGSAQLASTESHRAKKSSQPASSQEHHHQNSHESSAHDGHAGAAADAAHVDEHLHEHEAQDAAAGSPVMQLTARSKTPSQHSLKGQAPPELRKQLEQPANKAANQEDGVLVAFAWAEMSKELLQSLQAAEPGFHQVPGLEARLRQASGSYQILDVVRRRMKDDSEAVTLSKGELSLYFEPMKISAKEFLGGFTAQYRNAQGELRSPASATASIAPGSGAIVTMGPSTTPTNGVVILIMPRW